MSKPGRRTNAQKELDDAADSLAFPVDMVRVDEIAPSKLTYKAYEQRAFLAAASVLAGSQHGRVCITLRCEICRRIYGITRAHKVPAFTAARMGVELSKSQLAANKSIALSAQKHECPDFSDAESAVDTPPSKITAPLAGLAPPPPPMLQKRPRSSLAAYISGEDDHEEQPPAKKPTKPLTKVAALARMFAGMQTLPQLVHENTNASSPPAMLAPDTQTLYLGTVLTPDPSTLLPVGALVEWRAPIHLTTDLAVAASLAEADDPSTTRGLVLVIRGARSQPRIDGHPDLSERMLWATTRFRIVESTRDKDGCHHIVLRTIVVAPISQPIAVSKSVPSSSLPSPPHAIAMSTTGKRTQRPDRTTRERERQLAKLEQTVPTFEPADDDHEDARVLTSNEEKTVVDLVVGDKPRTPPSRPIPTRILWVDLVGGSETVDANLFARVNCHLLERLPHITCQRAHSVAAAILWLTQATPAERNATVLVVVEKPASGQAQDLFRIVGMMGLHALPALLYSASTTMMGIPKHVIQIADEHRLVDSLLRCF
jgi:hypothetical protein